MHITIVKPGYEIMTTSHGLIEHLERCGRTCYKSEDKITEDSAAKFMERVIKQGHESVLEHASMTVKIICDRACSHQLVRHRLGAYSQESQRYCNYGQKGFQFIAPKSLEIPVGEYHLVGTEEFLGTTDLLFKNKSPMWCDKWSLEYPVFRWLKNRFRDCKEYEHCLQEGMRPEDARSVLPNATKTEVVTTYNIRQWRHVFRERALNAHAQWQIKDIMLGILEEFTDAMPSLFGDLK